MKEPLPALRLHEFIACADTQLRFLGDVQEISVSLC